MFYRGLGYSLCLRHANSLRCSLTQERFLCVGKKFSCALSFEIGMEITSSHQASLIFMPLISQRKWDATFRYSTSALKSTLKLLDVLKEGIQSLPKIVRYATHWLIKALSKCGLSNTVMLILSRIFVRNICPSHPFVISSIYYRLSSGWHSRFLEHINYQQKLPCV